MEGAVGIEVTTNWVGMKSHKDNVEQRLRNNLQTSILGTPADWLLIDVHIVLDTYVGLTKRLAIAVVDVLQ